jgi:hypothetical protein
VAVIAKLGWKIVGGVGGSVAGLVARKSVEAAWRATRGTEPPGDTSDPKLSWVDALAWAAATAAGLAVSQLTARRLAAIGWERTLGSPPPGQKPSSPPPVVDLRDA